MQGTVYLVGAGPGDPGLITRRGLDILRAADVVVYDRLASRELLAEARADARLIYVGKAADRHALQQHEINELLAQEASAGASVCRLKGGDPFLFGRGGEEASHLTERGIPFVVVPGISSALAVPAYAGIPVTDRRFASSLAIATGHGTADKDGRPVSWGALAQTADTLVVLMGARNLRQIAEELLRGAADGATPAAVIRWGTTGRQQTVTSDLAHIAEEVEQAGLSSPAILVVGEVVSLRPYLSWFEQRPLLGLRILVTRPRGQASGLADLLREEGAEPVVCPVVRIEPLPADGERIKRLLGARWDWALFTSANAGACFSSHLQAAGLDWRSLAGARLAAIGAGTAAALKSFGLVPDFLPTSAVGEALAEELPGVWSGTRVLLPCAEEAREALPRLLHARGATVEALPVYRTVADEPGVLAAREALREEEVDIVTFTSSSAVRALSAAVGLAALQGVPAACIGPITAETARAAGLRVAVEAEPHTIPGVVAGLREYVRRRREDIGGAGREGRALQRGETT